MEFLNNLWTVTQQVLVLFLLMAVGFFTGKAKVFTDETVKYVSDFCLKIVTPAVIIKSFIRKFESDMAVGLLLALAAGIACHLIGIGLATAIFRGKDIKRRNLLRNTAIFSNAGFMGLPLQAALLGDDGVFYGAAYVVVLQIFLWTYAYTTASAGTVKFNAKKVLFNPGIISVVVGFPLFLLSVRIPDVLDTAITHVANLNTPLPMIIVGYYIANTSFKNLKLDSKTLLAIGLKLFIVPIICIFALYVVGYRDTMLVSTIISVSAPVAVAVTMFTAKFDGDAETSANSVSLATLVSIVSMPLVIALAKTVA